MASTSSRSDESVIRRPRKYTRRTPTASAGGSATPTPIAQDVLNRILNSASKELEKKKIQIQSATYVQYTSPRSVVNRGGSSVPTFEQLHPGDPEDVFIRPKVKRQTIGTVKTIVTRMPGGNIFKEKKFIPLEGKTVQEKIASKLNKLNKSYRESTYPGLR